MLLLNSTNATNGTSANSSNASLLLSAAQPHGTHYIMLTTVVTTYNETTYEHLLSERVARALAGAPVANSANQSIAACDVLSVRPGRAVLIAPSPRISARTRTVVFPRHL